MNTKILNFNAYRASDKNRIQNLLQMIKFFDPSICNIQEIHIVMAIRIFSPFFHVVVNIEQESKDKIGICTLVSKSLLVKDKILGLNGRIIGVIVGNTQFWNVYPKSGTQNKNMREIFFREELSSLMTLWKDRPKQTLISGDFNCIHRLVDSKNNPQQHLQLGLIKFMEVNKFKDDFISFIGEENSKNTFSRVTARSATRIDLILSNITQFCTKVEYQSFPFLDHKIIFAEYSLLNDNIRNKIPGDKYISGWIMNKALEKDSYFNEVMDNFLETIDQEIQREIDHDPLIKDPTFVWHKVKQFIGKLAKQRIRDLKKMQSEKYDLLLYFYDMAIAEYKNGIESQDIMLIINDLNKIYQDKIRDKITDARYIEIKDNNFDLNKRQKEEKFKMGSHIDKIKVDGVVYDEISEIVEVVENKMGLELKEFKSFSFDEYPDFEEKRFLDFLPDVTFTDVEKQALEKDVEEDEILNILDVEVDLDSSPGIDGITYRFLKVFWKNRIFRRIYLNFMNHIKSTGDYGFTENFGIMIFKNKKNNSMEYSKKRKLVKMNKDVNLFAKVWSNRCRDIIIDKIIPKSQFACRNDVNISDELVDLRNINLFLIGDKENKDGSILSIDYKNAFRTISLKWFNHVMRRLNFPDKFYRWFWNLYSSLGIKININNYSSNLIKNERGFMEGHPPSMFCFVISIIPLLNVLEKKLLGIEIGNEVFKLRGFADDLKLILRNANEIFQIEKIIFDFEKVSGTQLHRDTSLKKCNILCFGNHRKFKDWPFWVNETDKMKVIGAFLMNDSKENLEKENSLMVKNKFTTKIYENWGLKGTILQKVYFVNTFCMSRLTYLSHAFKIDDKVLNEILKIALKFIYAGLNERPMQLVNFRNKKYGGLGLVHPQIKNKSLLIKTMMKEVATKKIGFINGEFSEKVYGYVKDCFRFLERGFVNISAKEIYHEIVFDLIAKSSILVPSRCEINMSSISWPKTFLNFSNLKYVTAREKEFSFMLIQDILPVPGRLHRINSIKTCRRIIGKKVCLYFADREHFFIYCEKMKSTFNDIKRFISFLIGYSIKELDILHLSFSVGNKSFQKLIVWLLVKILYKIYSEQIYEFEILMRGVSKELDWYRSLKIRLFESKYCDKVKNCLNKLGVG